MDKIPQTKNILLLTGAGFTKNFGGLVTSTVVSLIFTPAIFYRFRNAGIKKLLT